MSDLTLHDAMRAAARATPGEKLAAIWHRAGLVLGISENRARHLWYGAVEPTLPEWELLQRAAEMDHETGELRRALETLDTDTAARALGRRETRELLLVVGRAALSLAERLK